MNKKAERLIDEATALADDGDRSYGKAADKMIAAKKADPTLTNAGIARAIGRSESWVQNLIVWRKDSSSNPSPYAGQADTKDREKTRRVLREAPMEEVERIIAALPPKRQQAIGAAAGHQYLQVRQQHEEREAGLTDRERRERRDTHEKLTRGTRQAVGAIAAAGIVLLLEQASEELRTMIDEGSLTGRDARKIDTAYETFGATLSMARALLGEE